VVADVKAASLNPHDTWTLKGQIGYPFEPPVVLGCDGAGLAPDGQEVVFYPVIPTDNGALRMLTDGVDGTFAPKLAVPAVNLVPKPANLGFEEAAGLGTAWLTAYRMLFTKAQLRPGERVLVQGASGGVASAAVMLASRAGAHVTVTSRKEDALEKARELGAHDGVLSGERLATRVDVVIETVGEATWSHSIRALKPGGVIVCSGSTSGANPPADLQRLFFLQLRVIGSTMGTLDELRHLLNFVDTAGITPAVGQELPLERAEEGFRAMLEGRTAGKIVFVHAQNK
jgi:NADPH:quinone reductase-like Zn-dependent oxidoreductase